MDDLLTVLHGDALSQLKTLESESVQTCVTSPPYWGLRDYGIEGQIGLERTPEEYVSKLVEVFREVRRTLRKDGTLWLNLGDSYAGSGQGVMGDGSQVGGPKQRTNAGSMAGLFGAKRKVTAECKPKDLVGIPWLVAFALRSDGWFLRSDIIWNKPNPMPESVTDRPTKSHEYIFLLSKSAGYFYDADAIAEPASRAGTRNNSTPQHREYAISRVIEVGESRNKRSVWTVATQAYDGAHFATFPPELIEPCILAGTSAKGCCPACGKPWAREVEKALTAHDGQTATDYPKGTTANRLALLRQAARERGGEYVNERKTLGWKAGCSCNAGDPIPCTVLDPFAGSGTTGKVALELGRKSILIELNPSYLALIEKRCQTTYGLPLAI